ncbi:hypothetical protein E2C01_084793 [Portunus trituberculatus]|uniref:Uncharacterized protein n=1 Tax=Portunus trituberculatus TaxID=210409 RepID=A0A5B7J5R3_PORTR|nr:hypothetical protein [Portunus trituberculatus]
MYEQSATHLLMSCAAVPAFIDAKLMAARKTWSQFQPQCESGGPETGVRKSRSVIPYPYPSLLRRHHLPTNPVPITPRKLPQWSDA